MPQTLDLILFDLPTYTAFVLLGAVIGLTVAYLYLRKCTRHAIQPSIFLDGALIVLAAGWVGARVYHLALNWDYYAARPNQILPIETLDISSLPGGLAMRGAVIAGFFALAIYAWARHLRFGKWADASALGLALGQAIGWVGALARGANYGVVSDSQIALELPDLYGLIAPRFPLQHFEIGLFIVLFIGLLVVALRQPYAGTLFLTYLLVASVANCALGFWRGDATVLVGGWRVDQIVDLFLSMFALSALVWKHTRKRETQH